MVNPKFAVGKKVRVISELVTMMKNNVNVPVGTTGVIVYNGETSITVDFKNSIFDKWSISHSIAEKSLEILED